MCNNEDKTKAITTFTPLLKKGVKFKWMEEHEQSYKRVQQVISRLPKMKMHVLGFLLKIYLAHSLTTIKALLAQEDTTRKDHFVCYVNKQLNGAKTRYPKVELSCCLALTFTS